MKRSWFDDDMFVEMLKDASNAYMTDKYVVLQNITLSCSDVTGKNLLMSEDLFVVRNPIIDKLYEDTFIDREDFLGSRLRTSSSHRTYLKGIYVSLSEEDNLH